MQGHPQILAEYHEANSNTFLFSQAYNDNYKHRENYNAQIFEHQNYEPKYPAEESIVKTAVSVKWLILGAPPVLKIQAPCDAKQFEEVGRYALEKEAKYRDSSNNTKNQHYNF